MKKNIKTLLFALTGFFAIFYYSSCKKTELVTSTTTDVNIYGYLLKDPAQFSEFAKILDKTGFSGFLNAYGAYTLFAPTNNAIKLYLDEIGKSSIDQVDTEEWKNIVRFHLLQDTVTTTAFKDGKLRQVTMLGQYLITGVTNKDGVSRYSVNRQATVIQSNIVVANGIIQVIDRVLKPAKLTLAQLIEQNPEYSIFTQALKETKYYDTLNRVNNPDTTRRFLTVFAETNKALADSGITSYAALKDKYSQTGDPMNPNDSLRLYVAYHIGTGANYLADIVTTSSLPTLAPLEVITPKLVNETVLLNDLTFNISGVDVHEPGVALDRGTSDVSASNGVLHTATAHFAIKLRAPVPVYWDVADFPEVRKLPAVFRKANANFGLGTLQDIKWEQASSIGYVYSGPTSTNFHVYWGDYLTLPIGLTNSARSKWFEFRTPLIIKGRYKIWICYRAQKSSGNNPAFPLRTLFDGEILPRLFDFQENATIINNPATGLPDLGQMEALGWKLYSEANNNYMAGRLLGTVDVKTTDRHIFRIEALTGGGQSTNNLDMIHFIPVSMNQISPRFKKDGGVIP